jgi:ribosomal protein L37AE/L43A
VRDKHFLLCPVCKRPRQSAFFGRAWACAECHKLLRRSQVIPPGVPSDGLKGWEHYTSMKGNRLS